MRYVDGLHTTILCIDHFYKIKTKSQLFVKYIKANDNVYINPN